MEEADDFALTDHDMGVCGVVGVRFECRSVELRGEVEQSQVERASDAGGRVDSIYGVP